MVLIKKGETSKKNRQKFKKGKTPLKSKSDVGDSCDKSDEAPQLQKTFVGKTSKNGNSDLAKKKPTPAGKTSLLKLKGTKRKINQEEAEDSEDDKDVDLARIDNNEDLDMDDKNDGIPMKKKFEKKFKHFKKMKANEVAPDEMKKIVVEARLEAFLATDERRKEHDSKLLCVGSLPADVTEDELKKLSKDIVKVIMPVAKSKNFKGPNFVFIGFDSEAKADSNFEALKSKKLRGQLLEIDFVGHKSKEASRQSVTNCGNIDLRTLYVSDIPHDTTVGQLSGYFKKAQSIVFGGSSKTRRAFIYFFNYEDAKEAFEANKEIEISGQNYTVLYYRLKKFGEAEERDEDVDMVEDKDIMEQAKSEALKSSKEREEERDSKLLWVGLLPLDVTNDELKDLSEDIVKVYMPFLRPNRSKGLTYAFIGFDSEAKAVANFEALKSKKLRGQLLKIDFVGHKGNSASGKCVTDERDLKQLYISGVTHDITVGQLTGYFKKAQAIHLGVGKISSHAFIYFFTYEDAKEAYEANKEIEISGQNYSVLYSNFSKRFSGNPQRRCALDGLVLAKEVRKATKMRRSFPKKMNKATKMRRSFSKFK